MSDDVVRELVLPVKDEITKFISNALMESQSKDDYREVLELASFFGHTSFPWCNNINLWMKKYPRQLFKKMSRHLWYLSEELVALAFFDDTVIRRKSQVLLAMKTADGDGEPVKQIKIDLDTLQEIILQQKTQCHFLKS